MPGYRTLPGRVLPGGSGAQVMGRQAMHVEATQNAAGQPSSKALAPADSRCGRGTLPSMHQLRVLADTAGSRHLRPRRPSCTSAVRATGPGASCCAWAPWPSTRHSHRWLHVGGARAA